MHEESGTPPALQEPPAPTDLQEDSDPLPDPGQFAGQSPLRHPAVAESQLSLDAGGSQTPPTHGPSDAAGEPNPQRSGSRWPLHLDQGLATVMGWKLINQQNACWLNATTVSFLWATFNAAASTGKIWALALRCFNRFAAAPAIPWISFRTRPHRPCCGAGNVMGNKSCSPSQAIFWDGVTHDWWTTPGSVGSKRLHSSNAMTKGENLVRSF